MPPVNHYERSTIYRDDFPSCEKSTNTSSGYTQSLLSCRLRPPPPSLSKLSRYRSCCPSGVANDVNEYLETLDAPSENTSLSLRRARGGWASSPIPGSGSGSWMDQMNGGEGGAVRGVV